MLTTHTPGPRKGADFLAHVDPHQLKAQGVELVGVYLKNTSKAQIDAYHAAGISVFLIHQRGYEGRLTNSAEFGTKAGLEANAQAAALGYPKALPIVFASMGDYDNAAALTKRSVAYFNAAKAACKWPAGAYGDWDLFQAIGPTPLSCQAAAKAWSWNWATNRWRGVHPTAQLEQLPSTAVAAPANGFTGVRVDPLNVIRKVTVWGPGPDVVPPKPVVVARPIERRRVMLKGTLNVALLQQHLAKLGLYKAKVDGKFGPVTQAAVKAYQAAHKLSVTGTYDVPTARSLSATLTALAAKK